MPSSEMLCHVALVRSMFRLLATANVVHSLLILVTLMMEAMHSSEMSVLTTATPRNIPDDGIFHSHRCGNLKSYTLDIFNFLFGI
jgi:hypothetical protein